MHVLPCPVCGYHAPGEDCPHCHRAPAEISLAARGPRALGGVRAGLQAVPRGMLFLLTTRGVKRFLLPPIALTLLAFALAFRWAWGALDGLLDSVRAGNDVSVDISIDWLRSTIEWILRAGVLVWLAQAAGVIVLLVVGMLVALWTFSIVYEACAGPFLDEIQGRIETRWFGADPVSAQRPALEISTARCAVLTTCVIAFAVAGVWAWWKLAFPWSWVALVAGVIAPVFALTRVEREYGRWLSWLVRREGAMLWTGLEASLLAGLLLLLCLPLKFIPFVGPVFFGVIAGFTTAVSLLDIPFSRRRWSLGLRARFLLANPGAVTSFGAIAGLLFIVPILGPLAMVPAASIGGQWLVCRLDKSRLRRPRVVESAPPVR